MPISTIEEVVFGEDLPTFIPDTSLEVASKFATLVGWDGVRFSDHEAARKEGLAGAMVPGILNQGYLVAMIHQWAPDADVKAIDTVFRAPVIADEKHTISGVVTDVNEEDGQVEIDLTVSNEKGETRVFGTATVQLPLA
jgi:acyl dehydratase